VFLQPSLISRLVWSSAKLSMGAQGDGAEAAALDDVGVACRPRQYENGAGGSSGTHASGSRSMPIDGGPDLHPHGLLPPHSGRGLLPPHSGRGGSSDELEQEKLAGHLNHHPPRNPDSGRIEVTGSTCCAVFGGGSCPAVRKSTVWWRGTAAACISDALTLACGTCAFFKAGPHAAHGRLTPQPLRGHGTKVTIKGIERHRKVGASGCLSPMRRHTEEGMLAAKLLGNLEPCRHWLTLVELASGAGALRRHPTFDYNS
jgi:hypothetical protein